MALTKNWRDRPAELAPLPEETPAENEARIDAYALANPGVLTLLDAAALEDVEARAQAELDAARDRLAINVKNYEAVGDGTADDTTAIKNAIAAARAEGSGVYIPAGTYRCTAGLVAAGSAPVRIQGAGRGSTTLVHAAGAVALMALLGSIGGTVALTAPTTAGGTGVLKVASTTGLVKDDMILVRDTSQTFPGTSDGVAVSCFSDWAQIKSVDSATQITVYERLDYAYTTSADIRKVSFIDGLSVSDLTIAGVSEIAGARAITGVYVRNINIDRVEFRDLWDDAIRLQTCIDFAVRDSSGTNLRDLESRSVGGSVEGNPYFVNLANACSNGLVSGCVNRYGRHMVTAGGSVTDGAPSHVHVSDCIASSMSASAFDTHPGARRFTFTNCVAHNLLAGDLVSTVHGFQIRGPDSSVVNPIVTQANCGISFFDGADRGLIQGGRLSDCTAGIYNRASKDLTVRGVVMERITDAGVETVARLVGALPVLTGLVVEDCVIDAATPFRFGTWDASFRLRGNRSPGLQVPEASEVSPAAAIFETLDRRYCTSDAVVALTSGTQYMMGIYLPAGVRVSTISVVFAADAVTPSNLWFALYSPSRAKLGVTNDNTTGALGAGAVKTLTLASPVTTTTFGVHYVGILSAAGTPPTVRGAVASSNMLILSPVLCGNSTAGLTTPASAPTTAAALTPTGQQTYAYVS